MKKIVIVLLIAILLTGCIKNNSTPSKKGLEIITHEVNVYSKTKISDIVKVNGGKLLEDHEINTDKLREEIIKVKYSIDGKKETMDVKVNIIDKEAPLIHGFSSYNHLLGTKFTFENDIFVADNYSTILNKEIIGEYDLNVVGTYDVTLKVTDESGNVSYNKFKLNVVEPTNEKKKQELITLDSLEKLPDGTYYMVDVSKWEENINWKKVYDSGIHYAMIRLGTQRGVGTDSIIDSYYKKNIKEAKEAGLEIGIYYYSYAKSKKEAKEQAKWVLDNVKGEKLELGIAFDWECYNLFGGYNINLHELNEIAETFLDEIEKAGYDPLFYSSKSYLENTWDLDKYEIWLAHYTKETDYKGKYVMWQFTALASVPGIPGDVDLNIYYPKNKNAK